MRRVELPPDFTWKRGFVSGPATTTWLHCGPVAVAVVAFHNDVWRTTVNRHLDVGRERKANAPCEAVAIAWVERWAVANAGRIRREVAAQKSKAATI
jgi:hypothetical protein